MKKTKLILLFSATVAIGISSANAQGCCGPGGACNKNNQSMDSKTNYAKNGGIVSKAGKYYVEMVTQMMMIDNPVVFYLMNKRGKSINALGIKGKVIFTFSDGTTETDSLKYAGENEFVVPKIAVKSKSFTCLVTFTISGENITTSFQGNGAVPPNTATKVVYTCPMHPEIKSDAAGKCPKCGMDLEKVK